MATQKRIHHGEFFSSVQMAEAAKPRTGCLRSTETAPARGTKVAESSEWRSHGMNIDPCAKLIGPNGSWLDLKAGDRILFRQEGKETKRVYWVQRIVKQVVLFRVFPVEYNYRIVSCARDWMDGKTDGTATERKN